MRNFSFFRRAGHSGKVRAIQMAQYLGNARVGPTEGYEDDICIYVKIRPPHRYPEHTFVDVMDEPWVLPWIQRNRNRKIKVIAISKSGYSFLSRELGRDDIIFIPENHCNYDRVVKPYREPRKVGVIGGPNAFQYDHEEIARAFSDMGLEFVHLKQYDNRQDVINFYMDLDIQVVWRQWLNFPEMNNPLKLANACSYGIPSVCYPEVSYAQEFDGYFIPVTTIEDLIENVRKLKEDRAFYEDMSARCVEKAEEYHIENIAPLYRALDDSGPGVVAPEIVNNVASNDIKFRMSANLLERDVILSDRRIPVYGLSHFRVSPRGVGLGRHALREMEDLARKDGKHAVVGFADDSVLEFYLKCGWHDCGRWGVYGEKTIVSSVPLGPCTVKEDW